MLKTFAIAVSVAIGAAAAVTAPAMADRYCGPGLYLSRHTGECRPTRPYAYYYGSPYYYGTPGGVVGGTVAGAGYVAGSAVNAAGAAVGTAGAIVGGVLDH
jgi:hypothetical protein